MSPAIVRQMLINNLEAVAQERKRRNLLMQGILQKQEAYILGYTDHKGRPNPAKAFTHLHTNLGEGGLADVEFLAKNIESQAKGEIEDMINEFRRGAITGDLRRQLNPEVRARMENVVREMFGQNTGDVRAAELTKAWSDVAEKLRVAFNDVGGAIGKLKDWGGPQIHDPLLLRNAGPTPQAAKARWIADITPLLNRDRMLHPFTQEKMTAQELADSLDHIWETITSEGWNTREPSSQPGGKGALFRQHADHRFLHFKDADSWLAYQRQYGQGDVFVSMMGHVHVMSKDIAAMTVFGPNPEAGRNYLKDVVSKASRNGATYALHRADEIWETIRGTTHTPVHVGAANVMGDIRNVITGSALGAAVIPAVLGDLTTQTARRLFNGLPAHTVLNELVAYMANPEYRREAVRAGLDLNSTMNMIAMQARYVGGLGGHAWSRYITDRVLTVSGMSPLTQAQKHIFGRSVQGYLSDQVGKTLAQIDKPTRNMLERHGITSADWDVIRTAQLEEPRPGATYLRPKEIVQLPGGQALADKYIMMILKETVYAVPEATSAAQSILIGKARPGTWAGEIMRSGMQFKTFPIFMLTMFGGQTMRMMWTPGQRIAGGVYAGGLLISLTLMGAVALQLKEIIAGRDPRKMTGLDKQTGKFWGAAALQGGGLGIFGDFLFADVNRFGSNLAGTAAGPLFSKLDDLRKLTVGNILELGEGKERTNFGREAVNFLKTNTPGQSLWFARLVWERLLFDQLQYLADPEAHTSWRRRDRNRETEFGNKPYWPSGQMLPPRGPDLSKMFGS